MVIFHSYVSLPDGISLKKIVTIKGAGFSPACLDVSHKNHRHLTSFNLEIDPAKSSGSTRRNLTHKTWEFNPQKWRSSPTWGFNPP